MYYSCIEHIEVAMEEVIDESGMPPELTFIDEKLKSSTTCSFCNEQAKYKISG
ncbi:CxxH/CxxC protein (TIGR04129 family) [Evansella vedderi]|uniref:CxxH/CxxC protein (TIGR04129 family) n=1 Tax=Evansella vedderi TaxID=38282 RepID=A0ABU0A277_9BACI|nr:CxxH/CxxC protein [Evansella vedderi]MDQ0257595.1 CxxH/CxxC protein (TIGR04129 family) [Evansella vedderi]